MIKIPWEIRRKDGEVFPAGTWYEVLLIEGETVNLCEEVSTVPDLWPPKIGRTVCGVRLRPEDIERLRDEKCAFFTVPRRCL